MSPAGGAVERRRLRAPLGHGQAFVDPPLSAAGALVEKNALVLSACHYDCQGLSLPRLAAAARTRLLEEARRYTCAYRDVDLPAADASAPLLVTGHQPQLFHPGVWFKNFALSVLGRRLSGRAVHLLIDNDTAGSASIRVPRLVAPQPHVETVVLDGPAEVVPYEERRIVDPSLFASFGARVQRAIEPLVPDPVVGRLWPRAVEAARRGAVLGRCVGQARHCFESACGLETLELPLSAVCCEEPFRWFAVHLMAQLPRFREIHNKAIADYRRMNGVRSRTHPVPELQADGDWLEAPFWLWTRDDPRRRRLFVRRLSSELELTDRGRTCLRLKVSADTDGGCAVEQLGDGPWRDVSLRPRALVTTMYARLALSDLFLHGIGGAKYDQLTDLLIWRFFGREPPAFLTLTATVLLPLEFEPVDESDLRRVDQLLRGLRYHPEQYAPRTAEVDRLADAKRRWIETVPPRGLRLRRHLEIELVNQRLQPLVAAKREELLARRRQLEAALRTKSLSASREYSFCLFPQETLPALLLELSQAEA